MYLKSLTALGFKSFADKTTLNFVPGVAAIVGPNGCGKSNISDAIRWVLGEQSAKALRGGEMADVIFNGTDYRKPLGMAEVSLTIGDVEPEQLRAAGLNLDFNEVTITRRVFRDGGSEYFINKSACRLRDIQQLFMGTGMGRSSYSIMAQGNITQILSSKPEDRRLVFEEAAGITRFKAQKKETLRKLEHTDQNLLRVADLVREVKRQIGSLQRQAGKARKYKQIAEDLRRLDTQLARHQFDQLAGEIKEREEAAKKLKTESELCGESVLRGENEVHQLRERMAELEMELHTASQHAMELKGEMERHESRIHFNRERLQEIDQQERRAGLEIEQALERTAAVGGELELALAGLAEASASLEGNRKLLAEKREALQQVERELAARQEELRRLQAELFSVSQQLARGRNDINSLDLQKQGNTVRLEKLESEKVQLEEEVAKLSARLAEFAANVEVEKATIQTSRGTVEERQKRLRELAEQLAKANQALDQIMRQQAEKRSRLQVLEQLQNAYEGFSTGTQAILKGTKDVLGSLTDRIRVPDAHIAAIETALGQNLQTVLVEQPETAESIIQQLADGKKGRANIASMTLAKSCGAGEAGAAPEAMVHALSVIQAEPEVLPLLRAVLGKTLIAPDLQAARASFLATGGTFDYVTPAGETLARGGVFTGGVNGANSNRPATSVLARKNQIEELRVAVAQLQEGAAQAQAQKAALQAEQGQFQSSLQQAQSELRTQEMAIATRQGEFNALQSALRTLRGKSDTVGHEIQRLAAQEQEGNERRALLAGKIEQFAARETAMQEAVGGANSSLEALRAQRDVATAAANETKVALAGEEQKANSLRQQQGALTARLRELEQVVAQRKRDLGGLSTRRDQFRVEIEESEAKIGGLRHQREQAGLQIAELESQKGTLDKEVISREESLKAARRRLTELQQRVGGLEVELAQKGMAVENLRQRIREKYQVILDDLRSECITITDASVTPPLIEVLTPEEMAQRGLATDWAVVAEQVGALQRRIEEMGPVNLVAIEEYEETEQRFKFLSEQHDDLVKAKEQLVEVLTRINGQTREMFLETFNKIRENFQRTFLEIFGGGKADLTLSEEEDVLESGIDILARPPGKQLQSISLLSGGEQTMTAVALLFSIYQVKPSPFCVLDELDAPLDESNINRFVKILQRFLNHSQFIIITHNKRTIGMADVLYGVTMEEHGVSKIVSVKFHKRPEVGGDQAPSAGVADKGPEAAGQDSRASLRRIEPPSQEAESEGKAEAGEPQGVGREPEARGGDSAVSIAE